MKHDPVRLWPAVRRSAGRLTASLLWATAIAVGPWLPEALDVADLTGFSVILSLFVCGFVSSILLGAILGRVRACRLLAACGVVGPAVWSVELTLLRNPSVHTSAAADVAATTAAIVVFMLAPLLVGAAVGRACGYFRAARRARGPRSSPA